MEEKKDSIHEAELKQNKKEDGAENTECQCKSKDVEREASKKEEKDDDKNKKSEFESLKEEFEILKSSREKLQKEADNLKDRLLRTTAEYENYRKRTAKEKESIYTDACEDVLKEMLPVLDNLERAVAIEGKAEDIKKGIEMTIKAFKDSLNKLGVEEIDASGNFDPKYHNAVMHVQDESLEANVVAEVFQKGYKKGNKVLRYSMVKVAN